MREERDEDARRRAPQRLVRQLEEGDGPVGRPPVLLVEGVVLEQLGEWHIEDPHDLTRMGNEGRQRIDEPDEGRDREARPGAGGGRRRSAGTWLHGAGPPTRASGGRGMRCSPPRAAIHQLYCRRRKAPALSLRATAGKAAVATAYAAPAAVKEGP